MKFKLQSQEDKTPLIDYINRLSTDKQYDVSIVLHKKKRSLPQNALYHLWLNCIAKETGEDVDGLAEEFRRRYLGCRVVEVLGEYKEILKSTSQLSAEDFTNYLDQIKMFCETELGINLPDPNDRYFEQFVEQYE